MSREAIIEEFTQDALDAYEEREERFGAGADARDRALRHPPGRRHALARAPRVDGLSPRGRASSRHGAEGPARRVPRRGPPHVRGARTVIREEVVLTLFHVEIERRGRGRAPGAPADDARRRTATLLRARDRGGRGRDRGRRRARRRRDGARRAARAATGRQATRRRTSAATTPAGAAAARSTSVAMARRAAVPVRGGRLRSSDGSPGEPTRCRRCSRSSEPSSTGFVSTFDPDTLTARQAELEAAMGAPGFWDDQQQAARISTEHARVFASTRALRAA